MKVVLFCGGAGVRMGEASLRIPKPMIPVGGQPILWHIMTWYAAWGHTDFILCLGHRAEVVKKFFLEYDGVVEDDSALSDGEVGLVGPHYDSWSVTLLDTGVNATIGDRLRVAREHLDDEYFLATYGDGLTDAPLDDMIDMLALSNKKALFMSVRPRLSYHVVEAAADGTVQGIHSMADSNVRINGGFFVMRTDAVDEILPGEDIMEFASRMARHGEIIVFPYDGFWAPMDTIKDRQYLEAIVDSGDIPWRMRPRTYSPG